MTDYNIELIDLLNEKIQRLENDKDRQRKEINRLKRELSTLKKEKNEDISILSAPKGELSHAIKSEI